MTNTTRICSALLIVIFAAGCSKWQVLSTVGMGAAAAGGAAAVYYAKGDLESDQDHDIHHVYNASLSTMDHRGYTVIDKNVNDSTGRIDATIPDSGNDNSRDLTIKLVSQEENITHVSVRVGVFGDESLSREILDEIQKKL